MSSRPFPDKLTKTNSTCIVSSVRLHVVIAQGSTDFMCQLQFLNPPAAPAKADKCVGDGVPLGALSVFEPLGGILSANLPVIYLLFANAFRTLKKSFSGGFSSSLKLAPSSQGSSKLRTRGASDKSAEKSTWIELPRSDRSIVSKPSEYSVDMT